jgi:hypothetical protein
MIFEEYFKTTEKQRWSLEEDIPWQKIDIDLARSQPDILENLNLAALIESYAPMYALKGLGVWWNSIEESAIASIQFYEEYKHYFALKRYLEPVGYTIPDQEIIDAREKNFSAVYEDRIAQLANYMISEHFTAHFYMHLLKTAKEPVLKTLLLHIMKDEFRHSDIFYKLLESHIKKDSSVKDIVLNEFLNFKHQSIEVVGENLPISLKNDFHAILLLVKKIERVTGKNVRQYKRACQQKP